MTATPQPLRSDIEIYCNCMAEIRDRLSLVQTIGAGLLHLGDHVFNQELVFLQLRKTLELIAFGSLTANKVKYSAAHANFATHWNAKRMLDDLEKVNPDFYPMALDPPVETQPGFKHFPDAAGGFMTKEDFVFLYDVCSKFIHTRNPFTTEDPMIRLRHNLKDSVARIQRLLAWHLVHLVGGDKWVVNIPNEGQVKAWAASPTVIVQTSI